MKKRIIVGMSGASGAPLGARVLRLLSSFPDVETHLIVSEGAEKTLSLEAGLSRSDVEALAHVVHENGNLGAAIASGSYETDGMIVVPCSMKTIAGIACGYSENLLLRAADVTIKEGRPLVLAARESPLSSIHLANMLKLSQIPGVRIMPPLINSYLGLTTIAELEEQLSARMIRPFGLKAKCFRGWGGNEKR